MPDIDRLLRHGVPIITGVVLLSAAAWVHQKDEVEAAQWVEVRGRIVDAVRERDGDQWAPVVEFEANGQRFRETGSYSSSRPSTGSELFVRYDPEAPEKSARILGPFDALVAPVVFVMGLAALLTGIIGALRSRGDQGTP